MAGMLVGALVVVFWDKLLPESAVYEMIPGFILAFIAIIVVSLITPAPKAEIVETFDKAEKAYADAMK